MRALRLIISGIAFIAVGIVFIAGGIADKIKVSGEKADFSELTASNLKSGMMVEGTIYEIWDEFAYEEDDGDYVGYFAFPLESSFDEEEPYFAALKLSGLGDVRTAQIMSEETNNYYFDDIVPDTWTEFSFTGKVSKLKGDGLELFQEYVEAMGCDSADYKNAYIIQRYTQGSETMRIVMGALFIVIGLFMTGLVVLIRLVKGRR